MLRISDNQILASLERVAEFLADGCPLLDVLKAPPGPYALFHHLSHARERCLDMALVFQRLTEERRRLAETHLLEVQLRPRNWPVGVPYPPEVQAATKTSFELTHALKVDFESLFHFGSVLLDQWSYAAGYLIGVDCPEAFVFHSFVGALHHKDIAGLRAIRDQLVGHVRWLHFWMRSYRNGFVIHANRPWQRGTIAGRSGLDFSLFTPSPPGWEDDERLDSAIQELLPLAPAWLREEEPDHWERSHRGALLKRVIENIGTVERQADRDRIAELARRAGLETPTFQVVAGVLANFLARATPLLLEAALAAPSKIILGVSPTTKLAPTAQPQTEASAPPPAPPPAGPGC